MSAPRRPRCAGALLLGGALLLAACADAPAGPRPNVIVISLDTVRADALTFRDAERAPRLTAFAGRGTVFTQATSGSSWTLPAHVQLFTGCPPTVHGVESDDVVIDPLLPTLPEVLKGAGYATGGLFTGWYLEGGYGFARGFDAYENAMTDGDELARAFQEALESGSTFQSATADKERAAHADVTSRNVVERAAAMLDRFEQADPDAPVFLFAHFFDPHFDYVPPPPYDTMFDPDYQGTIDGREFWFNERIYDDSKSPARQIGDRDLEHVVALYHGEVAWTDSAVGDLLDLLEERGVLDDAVVVITSDHGEEFFEHAGRGHRQHLFEEVLRVPLLVVPPASAVADPASLSDAPVSLSDVAPTVLDLAGLGAEKSMYGLSLVPALSGRPVELRPQIGSLYRYEVVTDGSYRHFLLHVARTPRRSLTRSLVVEPDGRIRVQGAMAHDLRADPFQQRSDGGADSAAAREGWRELEDELDRMRAHHAHLRHTPARERKTGIADTLAGDLRALGYLDSETEDPGLRTEHLPWGLAPLPRVPHPAEAR